MPHYLRRLVSIGEDVQLISLAREVKAREQSLLPAVRAVYSSKGPGRRREFSVRMLHSSRSQPLITSTHHKFSTLEFVPPLDDISAASAIDRSVFTATNNNGFICEQGGYYCQKCPGSLRPTLGTR